MDKKLTKWLIPAVLIVVLALVISGLVGAQSKATVGYIDMQRLQQELPDVQFLIMYRDNTTPRGFKIIKLGDAWSSINPSGK